MSKEFTERWEKKTKLYLVFDAKCVKKESKALAKKGDIKC